MRSIILRGGEGRTLAGIIPTTSQRTFAAVTPVAMGPRLAAHQDALVLDDAHGGPDSIDLGRPIDEVDAAPRRA